MEIADQIYALFKQFDRLPTNPDDEFLKEVLECQLAEEGLVRVFVFVCPKFNPEALMSSSPEEYMPVKAFRDDLFLQRVARIKEFQDSILRFGIVLEVNLILGDNDAELYIFPFIKRLLVDREKYDLRKRLYARNYAERSARLGIKNCVVWSLSDLGIGLDDSSPIISERAFERELRFFDWLFSASGPYKGTLQFTLVELQEMVNLKYRLYGSQGKLLESMGGVLLQTEGPGVWLERTEMLRSTGSKAVPAIYPWIRKEELANL